MKLPMKKVGEFNGSQLLMDGKSIVPRIPTHCDDSKNHEYVFWKEKGFLPLIHPNYIISCKNCGEKLELDVDEYLKISKIVQINNKLDHHKIDIEEHTIQIDKVKRMFVK